MSLTELAEATRTSALIALEERYGARNYHPLDVVIERGAGVWLWDVEGNKYLDCLAAYSAVNQGHCHPVILQAVIEQLHRVTLTSRAFRSDQLGPFYEQICRLTGFAKLLPMNTGAEAVETAIKAARKWAYTVKGVPAGQAEIVVFANNFHGRTTTIVGFSTEPEYRDGFGPFTPGFRILPFGDADAVAQALAGPAATGGGTLGANLAAILVEPIQGEAGIVVPPTGFLARLRELTRRHHALLVADEIQSGLGRTGKLFAYEHDGIRPDMVIVGKALSGGFYPVSGILADDPVMAVFKPGQHGSTYGGNPAAAAAARAALRVLVDENMIEASATQGAYFLERLRRIDSPHVKEVRGRGLWIGIELHPAAGGARRFCEALLREGLLCKETHEHVIRIAPPLVIQREEIDWALERLARVLTKLA
jgi:ornithine--oxo-acid transaminase